MLPLHLHAFADELMKIAASVFQTPGAIIARGTMKPISAIAHQVSTASPRPLTIAEKAISGMKKQPYVPLQSIHPKLQRGVETQRALAEMERKAQQVHGAVTPRMPSADMARMAAA